MASSTPSQNPRKAFEVADAQPSKKSTQRHSRLLTLSGQGWRQLLVTAAVFAIFTVIALVQPPRPLPHPEAEIASLAFWRYPIITNEIRRLPSVLVNGNPGPRFSAVWIAPDAKGIWIAGDEGILLHSSDGGATWIQLQPPTQSPISSASVDQRRWYPITVVEAASIGSAARSAPTSGSAGQNSPNQSPAQQQRPAPPTNVTATPVPATSTIGSPDLNTQKANGTANPVSQSGTGQGNSLSSAPQSPSQSPPVSQQTAPTQSRPSTPSRSARNAPRPGSSNSTDLVLCQLQGVEILGVYFRSETLGYLKYAGQPPLNIGAMCSTRDGGASWSNALFLERGEKMTDIEGGIEASGSSAAKLPNGTLAQFRVDLPSGKRSIDIVGSGPTLISSLTHTAAGLRAIEFADNLVGVAVGYDGEAIKTIDGGHHWFPIFQGVEGKRAANRPSLKFPAPWYYLSWIVVGLIAAPVLRKPPDLKIEETIANVGISDRPLEPTDTDPLGFRNLALSISRFLRNENTIAPITIAITGDWGTGKSSIMNLLRRDLAWRGFRPIWFNAWHNQTEDDLFATILQALRKQGVPQWWDLDYLPFRLRLLLKRWCSRWLAITLLLAATGFLAGVEWDSLKGYSLASFFASIKTWETLIKSLEGLHGAFWTLLVCIAVAIRELYRGLKAFGVDPASLLAAKSGATSLADLEKQTSVRQRFADEFKEVAEALGIRRRMVLFIDDLDRCMPENIRVVLEAVNFIVTAGECYVIMGLARRPVEAGVGLSFEKVAAEMTWSPNTQEESAGDLAKRNRGQFARQYLDKLINIEIPARPASNARIEDLVLGGEPSKNAPSLLAQFTQRALRTAFPVVTSLTLILATCTAGVLIGRSNLPEEHPKPTASVQAPGAVGAAQPAAQAVGPSPASRQGSTPTNVALTLQPASSLSPGLATYILPLLALAVLLSIAWRILRQHEDVLVKDSPDFRRALEIWDTLIVHTHATPRSTKRFMNRVRCLAMRLRPFSESKSRWSMLFQSPGAFPEENQSASTSLSESMLVALSAIYDIAPEILRNDELYKDAIGGVLSLLTQAEVEIDQRIQKTYGDALAIHGTQFSAEWPPTADQRILFLNMCADVTVRG